MARAIWTGSISFGLVNVPVRLYSAVTDKDVHFHQYERGTGRRVHVKRVADDTDTEVAYEDIVKGYELEDGRLVLIDPDELDALEPERSRTIDITDFVALAEIDPVQYERTYYVGPEPDRGAERPYRLLLEAMQEAQRVGIARFVMRGKEYLAAIRPQGDVLALETMHFPDEIRDPADEVEGIPVGVAVDERERAMALQLIESLTTTWDPSQYRDTHREEVLALIEAKARGEEVRQPERPTPSEPVADLVAALEASLRKGDGQGRSRGSEGQRDEGLGELTVDELQERAKRAGISGRSRMRKDELVDALREAS